MADTVKKLLKKIRGIPIRPIPPPELTWKRLKAEREARLYGEAFWERDKELHRKMAFDKAKIALRVYQERQRAGKLAEELRKQEIEKTRMKNLRKARRVLQKIREGEI
jgi:hypothetical protein